MSTKPKILGVIPALIPTAVIYMIRPLNHLQAEGRIIFEYAEEKSVSLEQIRRSDLILFSRNQSHDYSFILEEALKLHIPTIYDIDDNFWALPSGSYIEKLHNYPPRKEQRERYLREVSLVRTFNPRLFKKIKSEYNHKVVQVTPGIDFSLIPEIPIKESNDPLILTYVTGRGLDDELINIFKNDLRKLLETYPQKVHFVFWGGIPSEFMNYPNVSIQPLIYDYDEFIKHLAIRGYDIGLAPIYPNELYLSKTNTKFRDYGACKIPGIYSNEEVYTSCVVHEQTGLLVKNNDGEWFKAMERLVNDSNLRRKIRFNAHKNVNDFYRQEIMEQEWLDIIKSITFSNIDNQVKDLTERGRVYKAVSVKPGILPYIFIKPSVQSKHSEDIVEATLNAEMQGKVILKIDAIPFKNDAVGYVVLDHSLNKTKCLREALTELYRICPDRGQVTVVASYSQQSINLSKLDGSQTLYNEHTPRYWTTSSISGIKKQEYSESTDNNWGLGSPNTPFNFICMQMDFFYYPDYRYLSALSQRKARNESWNVCDEIIFHLLVIKSSISEDKMKDHIDNTLFIEPSHIIDRRFQERIDQLTVELDNKKDMLNELQRQAEQFKNLWQVSQQDIKAKEFQLQKIELQLQKITLNQKRVELLANELGSIRNSTAQLWFRRLRDRTDAANQVFDSFHQMLDDSRIFLGNLKGYRLQISDDIQLRPFIQYSIKPGKQGWKSIGFAFAVEYPYDTGEIGIEIINRKGEIILQSLLPSSQIVEGSPTVFSFDPIEDSNEEIFNIRVFSRNVQYPIRVFEWRKYTLGGLGRIYRIPFCSLGFSS